MKGQGHKLGSKVKHILSWAYILQYFS